MRSWRAWGIGAAAGMAACQLIAGVGDPRIVGSGGGGSSPGGGGGGSPGGGGGSPPGTCGDGLKDGDETGKDCGGSCPPCADGQGCKVGTDCESLVCSGGLCLAPACDDKVENGDETGVDCGGTTCPKCGPGVGCKVDADCASASCFGMKCAATCTDGIQDGDESAVDCGGSCPGCMVGTACGVNADCASGVCESNQCVDYVVWAKRVGGSSASDVAVAKGIALDGTGNAVLGAEIEGSAKFGGSVLTSASASTRNIALAEYTSSGSYVQNAAYGNASGEILTGVGIDDGESLFIAGGFTGTWNLGNGQSATSKGGHDMFVANIALGGAGSSFEGTLGDSQDQYPTLFALGRYSAFAIAGQLQSGAFSLGGGGCCPAVPVAAGDLYIQIGSSGFFGEARVFSSNLPKTLGGIAADQDDNFVATGTFSGSLDFGGGPVSATSTTDVFLAKYKVNGYLWSRHYAAGLDSSGNGATVTGVATNVSTDPGGTMSGNIVVAGDSAGTIDFGGGPLTTPARALFVAKLDPSGAVVWNKGFPYDASQPPGTTAAAQVALDTNGNVLLAGRVTSGLDFGGGPLPGTDGVYVAKLDPSGAFLWSKSFGTQGSTIAGIAVYDTHDVLIAGNFGTTTFGIGSQSLVGNGGALSNIFLARLHLP